MLSHCFEESVEKMAGNSTFTVTSVNPHPLRIDVVKFDGKNNFSMWRCEVMDALTASNLEDTLGWRRSAIQLLKKIGIR